MAKYDFQIGDTIKSYDFHQYDSHIVGKIIDKKNGYFTLQLIDAIDHNGKSYYEEVKGNEYQTPYAEIMMDKFFDEIGKSRIVKVN
jgi:hypothetical protein